MDKKRRPLIFLTFDGNMPPVSLNNMFDDGQAQSHPSNAIFRKSVSDAVEFLEDFKLVSLRNSDAVVLDGDNRFALDPFEPNENFTRSSGVF